MASANRVIAYIDGFNLYFGLREKGLKRCYWLNLRALALALLRRDQQLISTKYFTARIAGGTRWDPPDRARFMEEKRKRQSDFLEALGTLPDFRLYEGHYLAKPVRCSACGASWRTHEEKMTDVQIATELLTDAFSNRFDVALLISGDSDLVPPIRALRRYFPNKRLVVAFPPARTSVQLQKAATASIEIREGDLARSVFPDEVRKPDGYVLRRPKDWR
ncbi:MAG: NYN domain-containing protein [Planctomycetota bacterium]